MKADRWRAPGRHHRRASSRRPWASASRQFTICMATHRSQDRLRPRHGQIRRNK
uniref:Uncharacterized protein n=1 Tax=Arundo donax TaxID=35708 RepID=A0A0A9E392_ARUDO